MLNYSFGMCLLHIPFRIQVWTAKLYYFLQEKCGKSDRLFDGRYEAQAAILLGKHFKVVFSYFSIKFCLQHGLGNLYI